MTDAAPHMDDQVSPPHYAGSHGQPPPMAPPAPAASVGAFPDPRRKSPQLASFLSIMPGLGQVYVGYYQRGFTHVLVVASLIALIAATGDSDSPGLWPLMPLMGIFLAFFWLYNVVDAARRAALYNQALAGGREIDMPADFKAPTFRGSILGGACLAGFGFILLLNTRFKVSLDWIAEWWPAALILFGAYLIYKAMAERAKEASEP